MMKEKGIDPNNLVEATDANKTNLIDAVKGAYSKDIANKLDSISKAYSPPPLVPVPKIDQKKLMELEKKKRRARFGDALTAFGTGLQGGTVNPENFASTKIQRQQDKLFQDYKDATERNRNSKYLYDNQIRKEWIDWADKMQRDETIDKNTKAELQKIADKYRQDMEFKKETAAETARHNKAQENIATLRLSNVKKDKPFMVVGFDGQDYPLTQGEFRSLLAEATKAANKSGTNSPQFKDFQATMSSFKDNPLEGQKNIVQRYYTWKKEQESLAKYRDQKAEQQPIPQFNPDKAKKFKGVPKGGF